MGFRWRFALSAATISISGLVTVLVCPGIADAQNPPSEAHAWAGGATEVNVEWQACADPSNCYTVYTIYRNPPGFDQKTPYGAASIDADQQSHSTSDYGVKPNSTYSYLVCSEGPKNSDGSNCIQTNSVTTPAAQSSGPSGGGGGNGGSGGSCDDPEDLGCQPNVFQPPTNVNYSSSPEIRLTWTNPLQSFPPDRNQINVYPAGDVYMPYALPQLPYPSTSFRADLTSFEPHSPYAFDVCEGLAFVFSQRTNCVKTAFENLSGLDPVLVVTPTTAGSVALGVSVDSSEYLTSFQVTRQESDDPTRQGTTLANGEQGCRTTGSIPGVPSSFTQCGSLTKVVYQSPDPLHPNQTPVPLYLDAGTDAGLKSGVQYFYQVTATWFGNMGQTSSVVSYTVPPIFQRVPPQRIATGVRVPTLVPIGTVGKKSGTGNAILKSTAARQVGGGVAVSKVQPSEKIASKPGEVLSPVAREKMPIAIAGQSTNADSAQTVMQRGQAYCNQGLKAACINVLYMALLRARQENNSPLAAEAEQQLTALGVQLKD